MKALGGWSLAWRACFGAAVVALAAHGSLVGDDGQWPFAPMSQFAFGVATEGQIRSTYIEADTSAGTTVRVPLTVRGVGIGRAEIEGQLPRFVKDPSLLQAVAVAAARRHPGWPAYRRLRLLQEVSQLHSGVVGARHVEQLAEWTVDPAGLP